MNKVSNKEISKRYSSDQTMEGLVNMKDKIYGNSKGNLRSSRNFESRHEILFRESY